ncbi:uncharacterized protein CXQ87_001674 [Candidozyma duobushaemuli]|uniref:Uncharacterized protein n=2 Tax=Candidozyma TaxID=3303203 RepID=A0ABX8I579_9ASCO|nr:uncharacterized protein CXQ87_001674 [[Candida] duobushaemulonis]PVH13568.1 hypothetical protein CXQ87_001674 [[Candida] duobushaemulonis]QWU88192.1 hypothetical protein CA3LBN_002457 [[Candida] haemuloni]
MEDREKDFPDNKNNQEHELHSHEPEVDPDVDLKTLAKMLFLSLFVLQAMLLSAPIYLSEVENYPDFMNFFIPFLVPLFNSASQGGYYLGFKPTMIFGFSCMALWSILAWVCELVDSTFLRKWTIVTVWLWSFVFIGAIHMTFYYFKKLGVKKLIAICVLGAIFSFYSNIFIFKNSSYNVLLTVYFVYCLSMAGLFYLKVPNTPRLSGETRYTTMWPRIAGFVLNILLSFTMLNVLALSSLNVAVMAFVVYLGLIFYPILGLIDFGHTKWFRSDIIERGRRVTREVHEIYFPFLAHSGVWKDWVQHS